MKKEASKKSKIVLKNDDKTDFYSQISQFITRYIQCYNQESIYMLLVITDKELFLVYLIHFKLISLGVVIYNNIPCYKH